MAPSNIFITATVIICVTVLVTISMLSKVLYALLHRDHYIIYNETTKQIKEVDDIHFHAYVHADLNKANQKE